MLLSNNIFLAAVRCNLRYRQLLSGYSPSAAKLYLIYTVKKLTEMMERDHDSTDLLLLCSVDTNEACADDPFELHCSSCAVPSSFGKGDLKTASGDYETTPRVPEAADVFMW